MKKAISFDLETLDSRASGVILSIGAVVFDEAKLYEEVHIKLSIADQLRWGRTVGASTLLWWFEQNDEARKNATVGPIPLLKGLKDFAGFVKGAGAKAQLWANGQDFDLGILGNLYDTVGQDRPWAYNAGRDMRTLVEVTGGKKPDVKREGVAHDALSDAKHQALIIQALIGGLGK